MFSKPSNRELMEELDDIHLELLVLIRLLERLFRKEVRRYIILQGDTDTMANSITGIPVGGSGSFQALAVPAGAVIIGGAIPAWSSSDPLAVVTASADGLSGGVAVSATAVAGGSFTLSVSATNTDGSVASGTATVPYLPAPPPPPVEATSFDINQTA